MLYASGEIARKLVGIIYFNPDTKKVKISHLSFFGGRVDEIVDRDEILTVSEANEDVRKRIWSLKFVPESGRGQLFMSTRHGRIFNQEMFYQIFDSNGYSDIID